MARCNILTVKRIGVEEFVHVKVDSLIWVDETIRLFTKKRTVSRLYQDKNQELGKTYDLALVNRLFLFNLLTLFFLHLALIL